MNGVIKNFRRGRRTQTCDQMVVMVDGYATKEKAEKLVGKSVTWTSPGNKQIAGKVSAAHGNSGAVRVTFETGMPGQSIGTTVEIK